MTTKKKNILITGSSGLIGSEAVQYFDSAGYCVFGIDNNSRADFFGPLGDTTWNLNYLKQNTRLFSHFALDIRDREKILEFFEQHRPQAIIHCAAQPSHDLAKDRPFDDFDTNAVGTLNLLEAARRYTAESPFVFMSTNKVYGSRPNDIPLDELDKRYDYKLPQDFGGVTESMSIDFTLHSLFGASKVAADVVTQEYGRYFNMPTVCFRGGCLTGPHHSGVELHGFLSYLVKAAVQRKEYRIYGYKGKQVRDQIHSADVIGAMVEFIKNPRAGEVYNLGGGRENNISILECLEELEKRLGYAVPVSYVDENRKGDHICYISSLEKLKSHYPQWRLTKSMPKIIDEIVESELRHFKNT